MNVVVELGSQFLDPGLGVHRVALESESLRLSTLKPKLLEDLLHGRGELLADLGVSVTVEDPPSFEGRLVEHLVLDLSVDLSGAGFDVKCVPLSAALGTHDHVACLVLEALKLSRVVNELEMPQLLLLEALGVGVEYLQQVLAFANLSVGVCVHNLSEVFHQSEVSSHRVGEPRDLAKLWNERDLDSSLSVLVDEQRLVRLVDVLIVPCLVVLFVGNLVILRKSVLPEFHSCRMWSLGTWRSPLSRLCRSSGCT